MLYQVLIVEDELPMRQEMENYQWDSIGCELRYSASNGKKALEICEKNDIDIIITDIAMPVMDGIELTERVRKIHPNVKIIYLTCHRSFEYAQMAISNKVSAYVVKIHISEQIVLSTVQKVIDEIRFQRSDKHKLNAGQNIEMSLKLAECRRNGSINIHQIVKETSNGNHTINFQNYGYIICIDYQKNQWSYILREIEIVFETLEWKFMWFVIDTGYLYVNVSQMRGAILEYILKPLLERLKDKPFYKISNTRLYVCQMEPCDSMVTLLEQFNYTRNIRKYHFYHQNEFFFRISQVMKCPMEINANIPENLSGSDFANQLISLKILHGKMQPDPDILVHKTIEKLQNFFNEEEKKTWAGMIEDCRTVEELITVISKLREEIDTSNARYEIRRAKAIINQQYGEKISLDYIANEVGLSTTYFSKLFSREVGLAFNEYLTEIRMRKADQLIRNSSMKIYQIAEVVGIPNYRYFSRLYKSWKEKNKVGNKNEQT